MALCKFATIRKRKGNSTQKIEQLVSGKRKGNSTEKLKNGNVCNYGKMHAAKVADTEKCFIVE